MSFENAGFAGALGIFRSATRWILLTILCCGMLACFGNEPVREIPGVDEENAQLQVYPLQNRAVENLMQQAAMLRERGDIDGAIETLDQALELAPRDPEVLQEMAELQLLDGDFKKANRLARRSYVLGPKVGPLCERNWNTVTLAAPRIGDHQGAREAARQFPQCAVAPVPHGDDSLP